MHLQKIPIEHVRTIIEEYEQRAANDSWKSPSETTKGICPSVWHKFYKGLPSFFPHLFGLAADKPLGRNESDDIDINENVVIPVEKGSVDGELERVGKGVFGEVFKVKIHPNHHFLSPVWPREFSVTQYLKLTRSKDRNKFFALKRFTGEQGKAEPRYKQETQALQYIRRFRSDKHDHIITFFAAWRQDPDFFILFELARANLKEVMDEVSGQTNRFSLQIPYCPAQRLPCLEEERFTRWLLEQVAGIASALDAIHNIKQEPQKQKSTHLQVPPGGGEGLGATGYHHDIKLDNILLCDSYKHEYGILKLGDFGSASIAEMRRSQAYKKTPRYTKDPDGSETYDSPDRELDKRTSRKTDIWALGCVFLELMLWCFEPGFAVDNFSEQRVADIDDEERENSTSDKFWQKFKQGLDCRLKPCVEEKLVYLSGQCEGKSQMGNWLECIKRMLQISSDVRIKASDLKMELKENVKSFDRDYDASLHETERKGKEPEGKQLEGKEPEGGFLYSISAVP